MRLLPLVASPGNYDDVEELLIGPPALVYKLLLINSWLVAVRGEIHSTREAPTARPKAAKPLASASRCSAQSRKIAPIQ
jgi:hypothetical protein